jgi:hypothetical protein
MNRGLAQRLHSDLYVTSPAICCRLESRVCFAAVLQKKIPFVFFRCSGTSRSDALIAFEALAGIGKNNRFSRRRFR